jgi:glycosyltransferase involved in cell wall biosynthesis
MNMPTFYQADLFRALVRTGEVDLQVVFARRITADRHEIGWTDDVHGYSSTFLRRRVGTLDAIHLAWCQRDRIHIVNGLWAEPSFAVALCILAVQGSAYVIYSEAPNPDTERSTVKELVRAIMGRALAIRARGWLPISRFAVEFYESIGARREAMYPFGYFRARASNCVAPMDAGERPPGISAVFVGQVIERKGLDVLLTALGPGLPHVSLRVIGDGDMREACELQVEALGLQDRVTFEGVVPAEAIPERIARADVLILPSRWDGWGLVVNEALAVGVPVIVSDRCGAAEVIHHGLNGYVFRSGQADDLRRCLREFAGKRDVWSNISAASQAVGDALTAETVAPYLLACLKLMSGESVERPPVPWAAALTLANTRESA